MKQVTVEFNDACYEVLSAVGKSSGITDMSMVVKALVSMSMKNEVLDRLMTFNDAEGEAREAKSNVRRTRGPNKPKLARLDNSVA